MAKTLSNAADLEQIRQRIAALSPYSRRSWGKMSVAGMLCHLHDSYQLALGDRLVARVRLPVPRGAIKYLALRTPLPWAKGMKTPREVRQGAGGTRPGIFADDRARLLDIVERFSAHPALEQAAHPFFGTMTKDDWLRWGYLHADHHLRQFGT